ncbi:MAG: RNA methyltransferase [Alphaproteobacteria bacterium]|jgi:TrmH family RNA methyltransferase|nr:RNA methyltransferase [Alphaproteobacteria bacterium]
MERRVTGRAVTSLTNPTVKAVRALHQRRERRQSGLFLVEGLRSVSEALELGEAPKILLYGERAATHPRLLAAAERADEALMVTDAILAKVSRRDNPQTVIGVFAQKTTSLSKLDPTLSPLWIGLEAVRDPGNLGAVLRTADAVGAGGVMLIGECCDPFSVEAVRATMGSIFATPLIETSLDAFLSWRRAWPGTVAAARLQASDDYLAAPYQAPTLILMGNEQAGLSEAAAKACDVAVRIPMLGRADSLNLAVATGILAYAVRARLEGR